MAMCHELRVKEEWCSAKVVDLCKHTLLNEGSNLVIKIALELVRNSKI